MLDTFNTGGNAIRRRGRRATALYVANGNGGLQVVDVTDPGGARGDGQPRLRLAGVRRARAGHDAYVALFGAGLAAVNVTSPSFMAVLDQEAGWGFLNALDVTGNTAWVAAQTGLRVVDISTPTNLISVSFTAFGGQPRDVVHVGDVYLADDFYGLRQVDVTNPAAPVCIASFPSADRGMGVDAEGNLVVLAAGEGGCLRVPGRPTAAPRSTSSARRSRGCDAAPNPFNPQLEIRWELPAPASRARRDPRRPRPPRARPRPRRPPGRRRQRHVERHGRLRPRLRQRHVRVASAGRRRDGQPDRDAGSLVSRPTGGLVPSRSQAAFL